MMLRGLNLYCSPFVKHGLSWKALSARRTVSACVRFLRCFRVYQSNTIIIM